jgi:hypothetical protein
MEVAVSFVMRKSLANLLLLSGSIFIWLTVAEGIVREIDEYPLFAWPLPAWPLPAVGSDKVTTEQLDQVQLVPGVKRDWFFSDPPPLSNRRRPPDEWVKLYEYLEHNPAPPASWRFMPSDVFKAWNSAFLGDPCKHVVLRQAPGQLFTYDPPSGAPFPMYRFLPDVTVPDGLVTNQIGWRGRPIEVPRADKTVRIVFAGSSTVVDFHNYPFSHTDFVGHWLNLWAASQGWDVRFEVLNSAREGMRSADITAVINNEVLPVRPHLVVYYEGGNQFELASIVDKVPEGTAVPPGKAAPLWLQEAARNSALMKRIEAAVTLVVGDTEGREWPKPTYRLIWPAGLDEYDPDLSYPRLPVNLNAILRDLDRIRTDLSSVGAEFAVSSFVWMVKDGMVLDPIKGRYTLQQLNVQRYPFRYRDLERLANFQNRVFAKYAASHGLTFVDVARHMPFDHDLFTDAIHYSYGGTRLRGWIILQQLLPMIEKHLKDHSWPRPVPDKDASSLPTFASKRITFDCSRDQ